MLATLDARSGARAAEALTLSRKTRTEADVHTLMDQARGAYLIRTTASHYLVSLDLNIVRRHPDPAPPTDVAALRRDNAQIDLLAVWDCTVGKSMLLIVDLHLPNVPFTLRRSMPVVSIERLSDVDEAAML